MIDGFHVNGTALIYASTGQGGSYELLGYTADGADVGLNYNVEPIFTDVFGPRTPHDVQDLGKTGELSIPLIASDRSVLSRLMFRGDAAAPNALNTPGLPMGSFGYGVIIGITAPFDLPWVFPRCFVTPAARTKLGTKANPFTLQLLALPVASYQTTSGKNAPVYARSF